MPKDQLNPLLIDISFVTYMKRHEHLSQECKLTEFWDAVEKQIMNVAKEFDLEIDTYQNGVHVINGSLKQDNNGCCVVCNNWVTPDNKPNATAGLYPGVVHEDKYYCLEHLPKESPMWAEMNPFESGLLKDEREQHKNAQ